MSIIWFILLIGPLIFFHELGHFIAARAFGVGVIRFSIGFGPRIAGFRRGETEYVIGILPLGGYVRMVGHEPGEAAELSEEEKKKALWAKPIWQRFVIVLAGPLANLLLPLPIFIAAYAGTDGLLPARVGTVVADLPAARAGLESGDEIVAVDGEPIRFFDDLRDVIGDAEDREVDLTIRRRGEEFTTTLEPEIVRERDQWVGLRRIDRPVIGIRPEIVGPIVHVVEASSPAAQGGLQTFDRVVRVGGQPVNSYLDLVERLEQAESPVQVVVMRPVALGIGIGDVFVERSEHLTLVLPDTRTEETLGIGSAAMVIYTVQPGTPADQAGLRRGDEILSVDGREHNVFSNLLGRLSHEAGQAHELTFERDGQTLTTTLTPVELDVRGEFNQELEETFVGMRSLASAQWYPPAYELFPLVELSAGERLVFGVKRGFEALFGFILGIVIGVWQLIVGDVGLSNLGGPIMIFDLASRAGSAGFDVFLRMMAVISINLGILNLLPIPVLDGGSLLLFTIEGIKRGPITERTRQIASYIGLAMIMMLLLLVMKNDIERYWENFAEFFD